MISAINSGLSGLMAHSAMVTAAAGNLANLNTTGYRSSRVLLGTKGAGAQGALAGANVDPAREMVHLMLGQRGFQASIKVLQTAGEMLGSVLDIRA